MGFHTPEEPCQMMSAAILKRMPKTKYPIRIYEGPPTSMSEEEQRRIFRWRYSKWEDESRAVWLVEPNIQHLKEAVMPYLQDVFPDSQDFRVEYLTQGGFNKIYTATTVGFAEDEKQTLIIRVALPTDPSYKVESDVATMELVRCSTNIPVPTIYAYDSSGSNKLGLEWMLMEKVGGRELHEVWSDWDYDAKLRLSETVALWTSQLLHITSDNIGSVYMRSVGEQEEFYVGQSVHCLFSGDRRLWYDIPRGPFDNLEEFFSSRLAFRIRDTLDNLERVLQRAPEPIADYTGLPSPPISDTSMDQDSEDLDQPIQIAEEALYEQADRDDAEYYNWQEHTAEDLQQRVRRMKALRRALPKLCRRAAEEMPQFSTVLTHPDISISNIFIDDSGKPTALIDWEHIQLEPPACTQVLPNFLEGPETEELPTPPEEEEDAWDRLLARGWTQEEVDEQKDNTKRDYREKLDEYHCTMLRQEFKQQLSRLMPNLTASAWPDHPSFLRELTAYLDDLEAEDCPDWVRQCVDDEGMGEELEDEDEGEDEGDEDEAEDDEEEDEDKDMGEKDEDGDEQTEDLEADQAVYGTWARICIVS